MTELTFDRDQAEEAIDRVKAEGKGRSCKSLTDRLCLINYRVPLFLAIFAPTERLARHGTRLKTAS